MNLWLYTSWRHLIFLLVCILIFQLFAYLLGRKLVHSAYYQLDEDALERRLYRYRRDSLQSLADFEYWLKEQPSLQRPLFDTSQKVCVAIISAANSNSIKVMIGSLLAGIRLSHADRINLRIYQTMTMNNDPLLNQLYPLKDVIRITSLDYPTEIINLQGLSDRARQLLERSLVMKDLYQRQCQYGLLLEDTLVAAGNWSDRILSLLERVNGWGSTMSNFSGWMTIRLFANNKSQHWTWYPKDVLQLISLAAGLTGLVLMITWLIFGLAMEGDPTGSSSWKNNLALLSVPVIGILFINFLIILWLIGKAALMSSGAEISPSSAVGSGYEAANLYSHRTLINYSSYLEDVFYQAHQLNGLTKLKSFDEYLLEVQRNQQRQTLEKGLFLIQHPSIFQRSFPSSDDPTISINSAIYADYFVGEDRSVKFDPNEFLELDINRI